MKKMKTKYDLSSLDWILAGCTPFQWQLNSFKDIREIPALETDPVPARVPGSVQGALRAAQLLPDWNQGMNAPMCEWVENRHWLYQAALPANWLQFGKHTFLNCQGLDDRGWILLNGSIISRFENAFLPYYIDLTPHLLAGENLLQIIFDTPPRWLGQFGYTSQMTQWKPRFNYTWDWVSRIVQIGIWDNLTLEVTDGFNIEHINLQTSYLPELNSGSIWGSVWFKFSAGHSLSLTLEREGEILHQETNPLSASYPFEFKWVNLKVHPWWPNGLGVQTLYRLTCNLLDENNRMIDTVAKNIGFRSIEWLPCQDAPEGADPWVCSVNNKPFFLQGFNWTPIRPNFADVTHADYLKRIQAYHDLGVNVLRVWGGAFLEKEIFYNLCDQYGIFVWQEFPLSSSGVDNWPPDDPKSISALSKVAETYISRRHHHVSLLCWCGGNELQGNMQGEKIGVGKPVDSSHPLIRKFEEIVTRMDPGRRFLATSASGPRSFADPKDFGKGLHWDVHGPWKLPGSMDDWQNYWAQVDALFHSEVGAPGCSPANIIQTYSGGLPLMPASVDNPLWRRTAWWIEWSEYIAERGLEPQSLDIFVSWSQERQAEALRIVAQSLKSKFPRCGGVIFWMGHDCFPCTANTSLIDFEGNLKPAAFALRAIFQENSKHFSETL
jgi:beta-mannosidase